VSQPDSCSFKLVKDKVEVDADVVDCVVEGLEY
jgi:hypothetical protein